jgi:hypothetical protein
MTRQTKCHQHNLLINTIQKGVWIKSRRLSKRGMGLDFITKQYLCYDSSLVCIVGPHSHLIFYFFVFTIILIWFGDKF